MGSGGSGVYWFDGINWNHVTLSPGGYSYSSNNVRSMTVDTNNNLWVASEYGLRKFEAGNNTTFTLYDTSNTPLTSAGMTDVEADPNGGIWVGTYERVRAIRRNDVDALQPGQYRNAWHRCR